MAVIAGASLLLLISLAALYKNLTPISKNKVISATSPGLEVMDHQHSGDDKYPLP